MTPPSVSPDTTLAELAVTRAGASRVLQRHGLDFCCGGRTSLREACDRAGLDAGHVALELEREPAPDEPFERWDERPLEALIDHLLARFHEGHRAELPRLIELARKVEDVHADKPTCPRGVTAHLEHMADALEDHMQKEEHVLFPLIRAGRGHLAGMPIQVMEAEHREHGANLVKLRELAHGFEPPEEACATWRALYLGLAELERELMQHVSLENNALFPRALRGA